MTPGAPNADLDARARALHDWFVRSTGQTLPLRMPLLTAWIDWLLAGHNGHEMAAVIRYLRREVAAGRRNPGSLALRCLLDIDTFEKDLGLARMLKAGGFDPDKRLAPLPGTSTPAPAPADPAPVEAPEPIPNEAEKQRRVAELEKLKRNL